MLKENEKKKGMGWLKPGIFGQDSSAVETVPVEETKDEDRSTETDKTLAEKSNQQASFFSKDGQDKIILELIVPLENIFKERQLLLYKNKGMEDKLSIANDAIQRMKQELVNIDRNLQKKLAEISELENSLTSKQISYDQLLEDYKEYQTKSHLENSKILNQLDAEISKYNKLSEETKVVQYKNLLKVGELEERIRVLEIENQQYADNYTKVLSEKNELLKTFQDFTKQMSFSIQPRVETEKEQE